MKLRKIIRKTTLSVILFLGTFSLTYGQSDTYIEALKNWQLHDLKGARDLFLKEIVQNPQNDAAYYYLAGIASAARQDGLAEEYLKKAIAIDPDNFWYKYDLAILYGNTERLELATAQMEELIDKYPKKSTLYFDVINAYLALGEKDKALSTLDKIEAKMGKNETIALTRLDLLGREPNANPDSLYSQLAAYYEECKTPRIATILGDYYIRSYRDSLAMKYYDEATMLDENYTPAYYGKAAVNQMRRQYDSYFSNISHFIKDPGLDPQSKAQYISSLMESPQFIRTFTPEMDQMMEDLSAAHPGDSTVNTLKGSYFYSTGRQDKALEAMKSNMENFPESFSAGFDYLVMLYYSNDWDTVEEASTVMLQRFPGNSDLLQLRAIAYTNKKNIAAAIEDYQAILNTKPKDTTVLTVTHSALGSLYHDLGDSKSCYKHFEKALKINPDYSLVLNNYAYFLALEGKNLKKAKQMSQKTIEAEPNNATYLDTYAWILHLLGQNLEAKAIFKQAMMYGGKESAEVLRHYAVVLQELGETDLANIYLNQSKAMTQQ